MSTISAEFVRVSRKELEAFLKDNLQLTERYELLLGKLRDFSKVNQDLSEKLHSAETKLSTLEQRFGADTKEADELLKKARANMARLFDETDRRIPELSPN